MGVGGERNSGYLEDGHFRQDLVSGRLRLNLSPDFNMSSFVQFDTESQIIGSFSRLRWTLTPDSELFLVYTHNWESDPAGFIDTLNNELASKFVYTHRF